MNSTIKIKFGKCPDCPEDSKEKPLTAKRCFHHNEIFKAEKKEWKARKKKELNEFFGIEKSPTKIRKPIPKVSAKRKIENREYTIKRLQFLAQPENQKCPITGKQTTDVHHKKGRVGTLLLDTKFWVAVSREGHKQIEENPEWAKENNYSLNRI